MYPQHLIVSPCYHFLKIARESVGVLNVKEVQPWEEHYSCVQCFIKINAAFQRRKKRKIPIRWMHVIFGGGSGGLPWPPPPQYAAAAAVLLSLAECVLAGRQGGWASLLTAIENIGWRKMPKTNVAIFKTIKIWMFPYVFKWFQALKNFSHTITNTYQNNNQNMHICMNCKALAHIAKNYCFCPFICISARLFQWPNEWKDILSDQWSSNIGKNKLKESEYPCVKFPTLDNSVILEFMVI